MKISEEEVRRVADLANLALSETEIARMVKDLDGILGHMETLNEFFGGMSAAQKAGIQAVAMDMWEPFINRVQHHCPQAQIVFWRLTFMLLPFRASSIFP